MCLPLKPNFIWVYKRIRWVSKGQAHYYLLKPLIQMQYTISEVHKMERDCYIYPSSLFFSFSICYWLVPETEDWAKHSVLVYHGFSFIASMLSMIRRKILLKLNFLLLSSFKCEVLPFLLPPPTNHLLLGLVHWLVDFSGAAFSQVLSQTVFYMFVQFLKCYKEIKFISLYLAIQLHYMEQEYVTH